MSQRIEPLEYGKYYHIYNRAVGRDNLFRHHANYEHFLRLYDKYIEPVAETFAWCLMPNHLHLLIRMKTLEEILEANKPDRFSKPVRFTKPKRPHQYFSNLFNAYTKAFNIRYNRHGSLFCRSFERIRITNEKYFRHLVWYIHNNPVHHGFVEHMIEYPWSSYQTMISVKPTKLSRDKVVGWFNSRNEFQVFHQEDQNIKDIRRFIIE
jgi:REP element-mobilizing transposase RayT